MTAQELLTFTTVNLDSAMRPTGTTANDTFRKYLPDLGTPRFQIAKTQNPYEYTEAFRANRHPPWLYDLTETWQHLLQEPFTGVTHDGSNAGKHFTPQGSN